MTTTVATVAMLSSDIEGSTRLLQQLGDSYAEVLMQHRALLRAAFDAHGGEEQSTEGDAFFVTFPTVAGAIGAAVDGQRALAAHRWPDGVEVRVRIGVHVGDIQTVAGTAIGMAVHEAARIGAAAHGGQVLVSGRAEEMAGPLPAGTSWRSLGAHRLKDIGEPMALLQLDHDELPSDFPPPRSQSSSRDNLPAQSSAFIGRDAEIVEVAELLGATRLLTLTGAGGAGKSRLALRVAAEQAGAFPDGMWFVDLAPISDPSDVSTCVVAALGLPEAEAADVAGAIGVRRLLLLIDNCEHLVGAVANLVENVLHKCPGVQVMATSREPLGVQGEVAWRVPSLGEADAVEFFCARARAVNRQFDLTDANRAAVTEVCTRLDAIPLALELAAARLGSLSVEQLAARLDQRFRLLSGGGRGAMARQRTLQAAVDWSYELLDPPAQAVLRCLGVFLGGFSLDAAEAVCPTAVTSIGVIDVYHLVDQLVAKSLVVAEEREGEVRFRLLETIRQYALDRLVQAGEVEAARDAHAAWVVALVSRTQHAMYDDGEHEQTVLVGLDLQDANIRAAFDWLVDTRRYDEAAQLNLETYLWLLARGRPQEGLHRAEALLACDISAEARAIATRVELTALNNVGGYADPARLTRMKADLIGLRGSPYEYLVPQMDSIVAVNEMRKGWLAPGDAIALIEANVVASAASNPAVRGAVLQALAAACEAGGDTAGALDAARRATSTMAAARLSAGESRLAHTAAGIALRLGDLDEAERFGEQALAAARRTGDGVMVILSTIRLASTRASREDLVGARDLMLSVLDLAIETATDSLVAEVHANLAYFAFHAADLGLADEHIRRALDLGPSGWRQTLTRITAADIAVELGHTARAQVLLDEAAPDLDRVDMLARDLLSRLLRSRAALALDAGDAAAAVRMLGAAHAHRGSAPALPTFSAWTRWVDAFVVRAREAAGTEADAAWAEGEALDLDAAFDLAGA